MNLKFGEMMKILWIVNMLLPDAAAYLNVGTGASGTWMFNLSKSLGSEEDIELAVACIHGTEFKDFVVDNIRYFCIPGNGKTMLFYNKKIIKYWDTIEERFNPDIVHIHGTEYSHGLSYIRKYTDKKKVLTIQGIIENTSDNHWGGLPLRVLLNPKYRTLKEFLHFNGMIERKIVARKNVKYETEIIKSVCYATGRTDWDKFYMQSVNPDIKYYRCFYDLREEFYNAPKWDVSKINRNVIYASTSAQVPMKGGHVVIEALNLVRRVIPNVKVVFLAAKQKDGRLIPTSGYTKYIVSLIDKYDLWDNVEFVGRQNSEGIINLMTRSHITLVPSASENASATLREAMHLGAPCIASFRGGMVRLIDDEKSGFFFDYPEYEYLAGRIVQLLGDDELACSFSQNAIEKSALWHNKEKNKDDYIQMYKDAYNN